MTNRQRISLLRPSQVLLCLLLFIFITTAAHAEETSTGSDPTSETATENTSEANAAEDADTKNTDTETNQTDKDEVAEEDDDEVFDGEAEEKTDAATKSATP